jgi:hypothetical protein
MPCNRAIFFMIYSPCFTNLLLLYPLYGRHRSILDHDNQIGNQTNSHIMMDRVNVHYVGLCSYGK